LTKEADYSKIYGIELSNHTSHIPTTIVLQKFLRANNNHLDEAKAQLTQALTWRKRVRPLQLLEETEFDDAKFGGLGYVTVLCGDLGSDAVKVLTRLFLLSPPSSMIGRLKTCGGDPL
jgi:hypothetical protein